MSDYNKDAVKKEYERRSNVHLGISFILLGIALIVAINDMLNLGSVSAYFTWESVLMFIGVILFIGRNFLAGFLCFVGGGWFLLDELFITVPPLVKSIYWPGTLILLGIGMIITALIKSGRRTGSV